MSESLAAAPIPQPPPFALPTSDVMTVAIFREHRPEFSDVLTYPDSMIQLYLDVGSAMLNRRRWAEFIGIGVELFTCHMLALGQLALRAVPGVPGFGMGVVSAKSVSKASVSYDTGLAALEGGASWNLTFYGTQFLWFAKLRGMGGMEMLGESYGSALEGILWTWARGVFLAWGS